MEATSSWTWNRFPTNQTEAKDCVIPLAWLHQPLHPFIQQQPSSSLLTLSCTGCGSFLSGYSPQTVSHWKCLSCQRDNTKPKGFTNEKMQPYGLTREEEEEETYDMPSLQTTTTTTATTTTTKPSSPCCCCVLLIDTCADTLDEFNSLLQLLFEEIPSLPCPFLCLTVGATLQLIATSGNRWALRGSTQHSVESLRLNLPPVYSGNLFGAFAWEPSVISATRLTQQLLEEDPWPSMGRHQRPMRCTGAGIAASVSLLQLMERKGFILACCSGPTTEGPGRVVSRDKQSLIRTHRDMTENSAPFFTESFGFYESLMHQMLQAGCALHLVTASLDQVGICEMTLCLQGTGGEWISDESWSVQRLQKSLHQLLTKELLACDVVMDIHTSPTLCVAGGLGALVGTTTRQMTTMAHHQTQWGQGDTTQWRTCHLAQRTRIAFVFTVPPEDASTHSGEHRFIQLVTRYRLVSTGQSRLRVTTIRHSSILDLHGDVRGTLSPHFNQETAAILLARLAIHKAEALRQPSRDVIRWLDSLLIRFVARFGFPSSTGLRLAPGLSLFPSHLFHLRRSPLLVVFNQSPDETLQLRHSLLRSSLTESLTMIAPTLFVQSLFTEQPEAVSLDPSVLSQYAESSLFLDTFHEFVLCHGEAVAGWIRAGFDKDPQHTHFADFLLRMRTFMSHMAKNRFPLPRIIETAVGAPDVRYLTNALLPSSHTDVHQQQQQQETLTVGFLKSNEATLQTFMEHLKRTALDLQLQ